MDTILHKEVSAEIFKSEVSENGNGGNGIICLGDGYESRATEDWRHNGGAHPVRRNVFLTGSGRISVRHRRIVEDVTCLDGEGANAEVAALPV